MKSQYSRDVISHLRGQAGAEKTWRRAAGALSEPGEGEGPQGNATSHSRIGHTRAHLPALGSNAARPAREDTVHVRVVGVVPGTVFGADLGHKCG